jgi:hypothetical protein
LINCPPQPQLPRIHHSYFVVSDGGVANPFDVHSKVDIGAILRYETASERQLFKTQELERLQSARKHNTPPGDG